MTYNVFSGTLNPTQSMYSKHTRNCLAYTTVLRLFSGTTWMSHCQKKKLLLDFMAQGTITEADTPTIPLGATPSGLISDPPPSYPHFYARCPSCLNPPNLSWLGAGTKYAGLHTQWFGSPLYQYPISDPYCHYWLCLWTVRMLVSRSFCYLPMLTVAEFAESLLKLSDTMSAWIPPTVRYFHIFTLADILLK